MPKKEVEIFGAGTSGMIAGINLAREGYRVIIHDREKDYGGDPRYNPSVHTTPIDLALTSEYIGIDISPAFRRVLPVPVYFHDTCIHIPQEASNHSVELGRRPSSMTTLLYNLAIKEGIEFEFKSELSTEKIKQLPKDSIIACGLNQEAYDVLGVPYLPCYGWISQGECGYSDCAWVWLDECITEYGYMTATNNFYFDLLFSLTPVSTEALERYKAFIRRMQGVEYDNWKYLVGGVVPMAGSDNPRLHHKGLILAGTISGFMDPFAWFGILGSLLSGKIAALAVYDPQTAQREFDRFNKNFKLFHYIKSNIVTKIRPRVNMIEKTVNLIGPSRIDSLILKLAKMTAAKPISFPYLVTREDVLSLGKGASTGLRPGAVQS